MYFKLLEILSYMRKFEKFEYAYGYIENYSGELDTYTMDELDKMSTELQESTSVVIKYVIFKDIDYDELKKKILKEKENIYTDKYVICFLLLNKETWDIYLYPSELLLSVISKNSFDTISDIFRDTFENHNINNKLLAVAEELEDLLYKNEDEIIKVKRNNKTILQKISNMIKRREYRIEDNEKNYSDLINNIDMNDFLNNDKNDSER